MDSLLQDIRYAFRRLVRAPGFTFVAIATLALGIGANTTIFTAVNAFLLRPPDAVRPGEIVRVYRGHHGGLLYQEIEYLRDNTRSFAGLIGEKAEPLALGGVGENRQVQAEFVTGNFFTLLGVPAFSGRVFTAADDSEPGASPVVVLSHRFWSAHLGGDPGLVGSTIQLNGRPYTVAGIARKGFEGPVVGPDVDLWVPMAETEPLTGLPRDQVGSIYTAARLRPGVSRSEAEAELRVAAGQMTALDPARTEPIELRLDHARGIDAELRGAATIASGLLLAVVGMVLLTACANLASMLLSRALARGGEMGIRMAIGASRRRLVQQLLTESVLLALAGGAVALLVASWGNRVLASFIPAGVPQVLDASPDRRVLLFTLLVSFAAGIAFGLAPALRAASPDPIGAIKGGGAHRTSKLRGAFVVVQVTLSMILLGSAALFVRGLSAASSIDPGFDADGIVNLPLNLNVRRYDEVRGLRFYRSVLASVREQPGVRSATLADVIPLGGSVSETSFLLEGDSDDQRRMAHFNIIDSHYFETLRIPLVRGREFSDDDRAGGTPVAVVNEAFARAHWPDGNALGKQLTTDGTSGSFRTIVGVVRDAAYVSRGEEPRPTLYVPLSQHYSGEMTVQVRGEGDPHALGRSIVSAAQALDPALPLPEARPMEADMAASLFAARFGASLLGGFSILALLLAAVGIYGVVSYAVTQRTREIAIRSALGAQRGPLLRLMLADSLRWTAIGIGIGVPVALLIGRLTRSMLYGVGFADPAMLLGAPVVLATLTALASFVPARRATRVDPMVALRNE